MRITKVFEDDIYHGYAVLRLTSSERDFVIFASEEDSVCHAYDLDQNFKKIEIWNQVGGTMSVVQIGNSLDFLATQRFYPGFNSQACQLMRGTFNGEGWDITRVADFPYLHRFDLIEKAGRHLFIGCTICQSKERIDDWSDPGQVFVGYYNETTNQLEELTALAQRITKNHGYLRVTADTESYSLITGDEGVFRLDFPTAESDWTLKQLFNKKISDIAVADINHDGQLEYLTIEDFHGPDLFIYDTNFAEIYHHPVPTPFGHVVWGGKIAGVNCFIFGPREGDRDLLLIECDSENKIKQRVIAKNVGASNVTVYHKKGIQYIASANREINHVAIYKITEEEVK